MKRILLLLFLILPYIIQAQHLFNSVSGEVSFFSKAPLEDIYALNKEGKSIINSKTNEIVVVFGIRAFKFEKALMEEHFNENYMESDKYKTAIFKGSIIEAIDYSKNGSYKVTAIGELEVHGVKQKRTLEGTLDIKNNALTLNTKFGIDLKDHKIKIPKAVVKNIAESVEVTAVFNYEPK
ncbi:MAG: YceI family protein [Bacteroidetes bacterium]|nr:YceI family protein [Bacteroidota bacterium]HET6244727.1 YceI family protein [Bacteroidia bacterium]